MKFVIERGALLAAAGLAQRAVPARSKLPILSHVLVEATGADAITITATDLDMAIAVKTVAGIERSGAAALPADLLHDITRRAPEGSQIAIEVGPDDGVPSSPAGGIATVRAGRSRFTLGTLKPDAFPRWSATLPEPFAIAAKDLHDLVDGAAFAASRDETRPYLMGVYLHATETESGRMLRAVATDGHRLARLEMPAPDGIGDPPGVIIPNPAVMVLDKLLGGHEGDVAVAIGATAARFVVGDATFITKLFDGTFPDYERVIPAKSDKHVTVDAAPFRAMIERVTLAAEKATVALTFGQHSAAARVRGEGREAEDEIEAHSDVDALEIGFNPRYLVESLARLDADSVEFGFTNRASPAVLRVPGRPGVLHIVMPYMV